MKKKCIKTLYLAVLTLCCLMLSACKLPFPKFLTKTTVEPLPEEDYSRSTLPNIDSYEDAYSYKDVLKMITGHEGYMPSTGDVKILVIPVKFSNVYTSKSSLEKYHTDLERTFFGTDTGYESLSTYYYKSSYGKLNITGEVLPWYTPKQTSTYYENVYSSESVSITQELGSLANEILEYYDSEIDFSDYDYDKDGIIDGVYLVCNKDQQKYSSLYWSWVSYCNSNKSFDGVKLYQYMWSTIGFIYADDFYNSIKGDGVNAISYIHETGHMMGIDDFYDYSANEYKDSIFGKKLSKEGKGCNLGAGSYDMMDGNVGDHCANTKMMLGWINPYVITQNATIELNKFSTTGDAIIVAPSWNEEAGNLSEYFIIEYYDHAGLADQNAYDDRGYTVSGIRIYHINSSIIYDNDYWSLFRYDNSYTKHAYMTLIDAYSNLRGKTDFIDSAENATNRSLFQEGNTFTPINSNEYVNKLLLNVEIKINKVTEDSANITISFKD